ncbi:MAG: hypothetical protein EOP83_33785 [Verrucomicrobiaceae bacterium]|nr:MAG: hypothetical protein EOP83_33785 [Verrucomicrobiaceae bacterium]
MPSPKKVKKLNRAQAEAIFERFHQIEPEPKGELDYINAYTLLVAVVLSAQATDAGVNKATKRLFELAPSPAAMVALGVEQITDLIKTIGLYRGKAKNVFTLSQMLIDLHGGYRGEKPFWNSSTITPPERLRSDLELLPSLAEKGLCRAGKDVSNGGIVGTLAMLCHCSGVGAVLDLEDLPCPMDVEIERWLVSFPSFGYLLAISPVDLANTRSHFTASKITCREIGRFKAAPGITLTAGGESVDLDFSAEEPFHETLTSTGFSRRAG